MSQVSSWHSVTSTVYHNNNKCTEGNNIESANRRTGTGNKTLCKNCQDLNKQGK